MILASTRFDHRELATELESDPVVQRYRSFFALLDWSQVVERTTARPWPGQVPHPEAAYIKALLVKLCEHKAYVTELRRFLVEHPLLVVELGFHVVLEPTPMDLMSRRRCQASAGCATNNKRWTLRC